MSNYTLITVLLISLIDCCDPGFSPSMAQNSPVNTETKTSTGCRGRVGKVCKRQDEEIRQYFQASMSSLVSTQDEKK